MFYFSDASTPVATYTYIVVSNCVNRTACDSCVGGRVYVTAPQKHKIILHVVHGYADFKHVVFALIIVLLIHLRIKGNANRLTPGALVFT